MEFIYRSCAAIDNICVYAAQDQNKQITIVLPDKPALRQIASDNSTQGSGFEDPYHNKKVNDLA